MTGGSAPKFAKRQNSSDADTADHALPPGEPRAWVAQTWLGPDGRLSSAAATNAVRIFAVSVNAALTPVPGTRIELLWDLARCYGSDVLTGKHSLWVLPGGFFGFRGSPVPEWTGLDEEDALAIQQRLLMEVMPEFPPLSTLVLGVDLHRGRTEDQFAWVLQSDARRRPRVVCQIQRGGTDLPGRRFSIGALQASCFICGEFCGSKTQQNDAYYGVGASKRYLKPVRDLADCRLLIDLAHHRVRGTVRAPAPSQRMSHQRQLESFSSHGAGLLVHHHRGEKTQRGTTRFDDQSDWLIFRGPDRQWLCEVDPKSVVAFV